MRVAPAVMWRMIQLSASGAFQTFIGTASWIGIVRIIRLFGSGALAGYTIGMRIVVFALLPSWGLSNAAATMIGQSLGAGRPDRAARAVWLTCSTIAVCSPPWAWCSCSRRVRLVGVHTTDPTVLATGAHCLRIIAAGFPFYAYGMVLTQSFNGAGDTRTPTLLNLAVFWLWEIPLAYVLARFTPLGPSGVFVSIAVAFSTLALASALLFRRGRWRTVNV